MQFGPGSVFFSGLTIPPAAPGTLIGAFAGLSVTANKARLGQPIGEAGDPAELIETVEIPDGQATGNHFGIFLGRNNGVDDAVFISTFFGFNVSNKNGAMFQGIGTFPLPAGSVRWTINTPDGDSGVIECAASGTPGADGFILFNGDTVNPARWDVICPWIMDNGWGHGNAKIDSTIAVHALGPLDSLLLIDTTAGNLQININVVAGGYGDQRFIFKKTSADVNTITLNMVAGTIQGIGAPAATFVFNLQGESIEIYCDDLNAYII